MNTRHPFNPNLVLHVGDRWRGLPVLTHRGPLVDNYLDRIYEVIGRALQEHPRTSVMRFELRIPAGWAEVDAAVISRFIESLKARLVADALRKGREGRRVYPCRLRYVWAKERAGSDHVHYHVAIFVNRDAYFTLGRFKAQKLWGEDDTFLAEDEVTTVNMADRIIGAWASALGVLPEQAVGLVHFPDNPVYSINANSQYCMEQVTEVFRRLSYLAKAETKHYGDRTNSFGYSMI